MLQIFEKIRDKFGKGKEAVQEKLGNRQLRLSKMRERKIKRFIRHFLQLFSLPIVLVYYEVIMQIARGSNLSFFYPIFFAAGIGLIISALLIFLPKRFYIRVKFAITCFFAVVFIIECLIRSSFQQYMTFSTILGGSGGVAGHYSGQLFSAIIGGIPIIILYALPLIIHSLIYRRFRKLKTSQPRKKQLAIGAAGLVLFVFTWLVASLGPSSAIYKANYTFNNAIQKFGFLTGLRLDVQYGVFGNSSQSDLTITDSKDATDYIPVDDTKVASSESSSSSISDSSTETSSETETSSKSEDTEETSEESGVFTWEASDELNVMEIDFDALAAATDITEYQQLCQYVSTVSATHKNSYTGAFAGKNLILITAEALSDCAVDENLTPNLYRLVNNGIKFEDFYQPSWGGSTSTGEFSFLTGLIPSYGTDTIMLTKDHNLYFTLGNSLQRQNYWSAAYHNGEYNFYNRDQTHTNLGYSQWIASCQDLESIVGYSYPSDSVLFDQTLLTYIDNTPFSTYYMSMSGHSNYVQTSDFVTQYLDTVNQYYGDTYLETTKYYLCYQMELDKALGFLIAELENAGIADDTVIALCPDHYPYGLEQSATFGNDQDYLADLYGYVYTTWKELDHSTAVIWSECMEKDPSEEGYVAPQTITSCAYSIDLVPTLLNLFCIEYDSRLLPGRDVLDPTTEGFVVWSNYSWLTEYIYHDSGTGQNYLMDGSGELAGSDWDEYIAAKSAEAANKINYSDMVVNFDYYAFLFGPDENF